jgi:hypothetical protein
MKSFVVLVLLLAFTSLQATEISPEKRQEINRLLKLTNMENIMSQMLDQIIGGFKTQIPDIPADYWETFKKNVDVHEFMEAMVPLYDKYYTLEDLKAVNAFYETPSGQKILKTMPQLLQESMKLGQEWGARIGQKAILEIEQKQRDKKKEPKA